MALIDRDRGKSTSTHSIPSDNADGDDEFAGVDLAGGNFWEIGQYKPVLKRIAAAPKRCDELVKMLQERAKIEKSYAKDLAAFADKWEEKLNSKIQEYGTLKVGWQALLDETRDLSDIHMGLKDKLTGELSDKIDNWKKEHYKKNVMMGYKSYKRSQAAFEKAQKPWQTLHDKVDKHRNNIEKQRQTEELMNKHIASGVGGETKKLEANIAKAKKERNKSEVKLNQRVQEMQKYAPIYRSEMELEFQRCQAEEKQRIEFFKTTLLEIYQTMAITESLQKTHDRHVGKLNNITATDDLAKFSREFGVDMPMILPDENGNWRLEGTGQAYTAPVTTNTVQKTNTNNLEVPGGGNPISPMSTRGSSRPSISSASTLGGLQQQQPSPPPPPPPPMPAGDISKMPKGTRLHALYDYEATRPDELSFSFDDVIILDGPAVTGEPGWLSGKLEDTGQTGIFPINYVEAS